MMIKFDKKNTQFIDLVGTMNLISDFGQYFSIFYPTILVLLCLLNYFDVFTKISDLFGISSFSFKNFESCEVIAEGYKEFIKSIY